MPNAPQTFGRALPAAGVVTTLWTVPAGAADHCTMITACNTTGAAAAIRVSTRPTGEALAGQHYIFDDLPLDPNDTFIANLALMLAAGDVVEVWSSSGTVAFHASGVRIT